MAINLNSLNSKCYEKGQVKKKERGTRKILGS